MVHEKAPASPTLEQDRLYAKLAKGSSKATQVVPNYPDFRLGHGDPLLKATIKHDLEMASPRTKRKILQDMKEREVHLIQSISPLAGMGMNDIVHIDKQTVMSIPCVPNLTKPEGYQTAMPTRLGMNDRVHLPNGEVVSVPMIPTVFSDDDKIDCLDDHGSPLSGLGMSDIVHIGKKKVLRIPCLPIYQS